MPLIDYLIKEVSIQLGSPVLLFRFEIEDGSGDLVWRYCNLSRDYQIVEGLYYASTIKMSKLVQSQEVNKDVLELRFPRTDNFARMFVGFMPEFPCGVLVYRAHLTQEDTEYESYWTGRVGSSKTDSHYITLNCESDYTTMRSAGVRARYLRTCRHLVYRPGCNLDMDDFAVPAVLSAITSTTLTSATFATVPDGTWIGGILKAADGSMRYIVDHLGDTITVWRQIQSILDEFESGVTPVTVHRGCDRSRETCNTAFSNIANYGGFPLLPARNPMDGRSII